jgi:hypothetical protein
LTERLACLVHDQRGYRWVERESLLKVAAPLIGQAVWKTSIEVPSEAAKQIPLGI